MKTLLSLESLLKENETLEKRVFSVRSVRTSLLYIKRKEKREKRKENEKQKSFYLRRILQNTVTMLELILLCGYTSFLLKNGAPALRMALRFLLQQQF